MHNVTLIPVTEVRKGMQTFRRDHRSGKIRKDVRIGDPFTHSGSIQHMAFHTIDGNGKRNGTVVYSPCARVLVGYFDRRNKRR